MKIPFIFNACFSIKTVKNDNNDDIIDSDIIDKDIDKKIVCIGLPKTGTKSLAKAFAILNYSVNSNPMCIVEDHVLLDNDIKYYCDENHDNDNIHVFEAFHDIPYSINYKNIYNTYNNSKFILTVRDSDSWFKSLYNYQFLPNAVNYKFIKYFFNCDIISYENKDIYINAYEKYNKDVINYFNHVFEIKKTNVLVINIFENSSEKNWKLICDFLDVEKPKNIVFPKENINHKNI